MSQVVERSLPDLLAQIVDNRGRSCPVTDIGFPLIATNCIKDDHKYPLFENVRYVDSDTYDHWFRGHPQPKDILFVCKGSPGRVAVVPDPVPFCIAQDMVALRVDSCVADPGYLYYRLKTPDVKGKIENLHVGTMIPHFKKGDFGKLKFDIHADIGEQRAIAEVLEALDDKIAGNSGLVSIIESLAETMFREVMSSAMKSATVGSILTLEYGKSMPASRRKDGSVAVYGSGGVVGRHDQALLTGPGVVVGRKGTAGSVHWAADPFYPIDTTFYVVPSSEAFPMIFCYFALRSLGLNEMNSDSAVPGLNRNEAHAAITRIPETAALATFGSSATVLFQQRAELHRESESLAAMRDALLPQLMSGKIRVKDVEQIVGDVV